MTRHAAELALAALLALVIHQVAYLLAFPVAAVRADRLADHGHLSTQWALITPLAVMATAAFIVRQVRLLGLTPKLHTRPLALAGSTLFLIQEAIEAGLSTEGLTALVANPATAIGLVVAPFLAAGLVRALRQATELVARFLKVPVVAPPMTRVVPRPRALPHPQVLCLGATSPRGPPRLIRF